ncbi:MAG: GxxExxY protein [Dehalococcoidia bacterium]
MINKVKNFLHEELTYKIRGCVFEVYKTLGNGHKEKVYHEALKKEFTDKNIIFTHENRVNVVYKEKKVGVYAPDFVVDGIIVVEIKAKPFLHRDDIDQFWHYLNGTKYRLGLLVNFGAHPKVEIIRRVH